MGADITGVADRQGVEIRHASEFLHHFKGGRFLALQTHGVDGINYNGLSVAGKLTHRTHGIVKVSINLQDVRAVDDGLGNFSSRHFAGGIKTIQGNPGASA